MLNEWYERVYLEGIIGKRMYNQYEKKSIKWIWHMTRNDGPCKKKETHDPTPIECKTRSLPLPSPPLPTKSSPTRNSCISSSGQELLYRTLGAVIKETLAWPTKKTCEMWNRTISSGSSASNFQFSRASNCHLCHTGIDPEIWVQNASFWNSAQCDHLALHSFNNLHYMNIGRTTLVFLGGALGLGKNRKCTPMNIERPPSS
jgi:hypothetical protein